MTTPIMTKPSSIAARLRVSGVIEAAVETHGNEAAEIFNARYPAGEGPAVDYTAVFANFGEDLRSAREQMTTANDAHAGILARIVRLRKERDTLTKQLAGDFFVARRTLEAMAGSEQRFELLAVSGKTPRDPVGLIRQVRSTVGFLASPKVPLPDPGLGISVDLSTMAGRLGAGADALDAVLADLDRERKLAEATRQAKNEAIVTYDRTSRYVARSLEGMFHLAGLHEFAERVRPSSPRSGGIAGDGEPMDGEPADEPPAEAPAEEVAAAPPAAADG